MKQPARRKNQAAASTPSKGPEAPGIYPITWHDGLAMATVTKKSEFTSGFELRYESEKPHKHNGKILHWVVEGKDWGEDGKTVLRLWGQTWFETRQQAVDALPKLREWYVAELKSKIVKPETPAEQDLREARLKVMREQYPDTAKAMDAVREASAVARPVAIDALFRAYAVDLVRLHKPEKLSELLPFKLELDGLGLISEIAKAREAKSPYDAVDTEIAARWFAAGYDKMSPEQYTAAINERTSASVTRAAMRQRRKNKFRLMSSRREGRPEKPWKK